VLLVYAAALCLFYFHYGSGLAGCLILGFGFHEMTSMEFANLLQSSWAIDLRFYLKNEVLAYFIIPIIFMGCNIGQSSLKVYALVSGAMMGCGALIL
jgi:hypothetical protein